MNRVLLPFLGFVILLMGCEATTHYNRTKVVTFGQPLPEKPYGSVKLYEDKNDVPESYDTIAILSVSGDPGEEAQFIKAFLYRAADLGADAIIFSRVSLAAGTEGGGWAAGSGGALGMPQEVGHNGVYRGEAIVFK